MLDVTEQICLSCVAWCGPKEKEPSEKPTIQQREFLTFISLQGVVGISISYHLVWLTIRKIEEAGTAFDYKIDCLSVVRKHWLACFTLIHPTPHPNLCAITFREDAVSYRGLWSHNCKREATTGLWSNPLDSFPFSHDWHLCQMTGPPNISLETLWTKSVALPKFLTSKSIGNAANSETSMELGTV